jgi:hypothetical protein
LLAFGNQAFVIVKIITALGLAERRAVPVAVDFFPKPPVQRVVAVTGNRVVAGVLDFDENGTDANGGLHIVSA